MAVAAWAGRQQRLLLGQGWRQAVPGTEGMASEGAAIGRTQNIRSSGAGGLGIPSRALPALCFGFLRQRGGSQTGGPESDRESRVPRNPNLCLFSTIILLVDLLAGQLHGSFQHSSDALVSGRCLRALDRLEAWPRGVQRGKAGWYQRLPHLAGLEGSKSSSSRHTGFGKQLQEELATIWTGKIPGGTGSSEKSTVFPALCARMASWYCWKGKRRLSRATVGPAAPRRLAERVAAAP